MGFPGEEIVSVAIDKLSDGLIKKMEESEAKREREFAYKLKELEFYKNSYDKELRDIFDYWFELVRITHIKDNKNITEDEKRNFGKKYNELIKVSKISQYKMKTLKYGGSETGRVLALENKLHQEKYKNKPSSVDLYMWFCILAVLKKEILGQEMSPCDMIQVLVNDYDDNEAEIMEAKEYIKEIYFDVYKEYPYWGI